MTLELTKKQYLALLKIAFLGEWVANAHRTEGFAEEIRGAENLLLEHAAEFGLADYVSHDADDGDRYYSSQKLELKSGLHELIDEYDEETFWDELIARLAERDYARQYSQRARLTMTKEEFFSALGSLEDKYADETEEHGLDRFEIVTKNDPAL